MKVLNILRHALKPAYRREMVQKLRVRWRERQSSSDRENIREWCRIQSSDVSAWATRLDARLWGEATEFEAQQRALAHDKLSEIGVELGGGGAYNLLYFLTRLISPSVVVETGVAAGFSSRAILSALKINGGGHLYSSDFPYFRLRAPEQYVGILVEPELRGDWEPLIKGDRHNLPQIASKLTAIDLVHYDSDKSYAGREFALRTLSPLLTKDSVVIFDDIQDNWHFRDISKERRYRIFPFEEKWVGMLGGVGELYAS